GWVSSGLKSEEPCWFMPRSAMDDRPGSAEDKSSTPACCSPPFPALSPALSPPPGLLFVGGWLMTSPALMASVLIFVALRISPQREITLPPGQEMLCKSLWPWKAGTVAVVPAGYLEPPNPPERKLTVPVGSIPA